MKREVLAEESWLLTVVVVGYNKGIICQCILDVVLPQQICHDLVEASSVVRRVSQHVDPFWDVDSQNQSKQESEGHRNPFLESVSLVLHLLVFDGCEGVVDFIFVHLFIEIQPPDVEILEELFVLWLVELVLFVFQEFLIDHRTKFSFEVFNHFFSLFGMFWFFTLDFSLVVFNFLDDFFKAREHFFVVVQVNSKQKETKSKDSQV